jgi:hypothetical protein
LRVAVVLQEHASRDVLTQVRAALAATIDEAGALPLPIEVVPTVEIPRESGHAAKLKLIKAV